MAKLEHAGVTVEMLTEKPFVRITISALSGAWLSEDGDEAVVMLPSLEAAETLRDSLSAFIKFQRAMNISDAHFVPADTIIAGTGYRGSSA